MHTMPFKSCLSEGKRYIFNLFVLNIIFFENQITDKRLLAIFCWHPSVNRPRKSLHFRDVQRSFYSFERLLYKHSVLARCKATSIVVVLLICYYSIYEHFKVLVL